jgi:hypothetical protein
VCGRLLTVSVLCPFYVRASLLIQCTAILPHNAAVDGLRITVTTVVAASKVCGIGQMMPARAWFEWTGHARRYERRFHPNGAIGARADTPNV